jgi:hypothetical protein
MAKAPQTLEQLYDEARTDLLRGGGELALKWAFKHARAAGRLLAAMKAREHAERMELRQAVPLPGESPVSVESHALAMQGLRAAFGDVEEAKAIETACAHVMRMAERLPARANVAPAARRAA